jgi:Fic family protein
MGRGARGTYVEARLEADFSRAGGRRAAGGTYRAFIPSLIAEADFDLDTATAALTERAASAVADLNRHTAPLASLEGLGRQLLRSEALASSQIEGLSLSHRKLAQATLEGQGTHKALEVLGNMRAMVVAVESGGSARPLTVEDVEKIHATLAIVPPLDRIAGRLRQEQGWIGGTSPLDAEYVGPPWERVRELVADVCAFMSRDDVPVVAQAAIAHAQFELIHPFGDGNGRTGRCLIHALFRRRGIAPRYMPPVSLILGANKDAYIAGLNAYRDGNVTDWIEHFSRAVEKSAHSAENFSDQVRTLQKDWIDRAEPMRADSVAREIIEMLPSFPFITTSVIMNATGKSNRAVLNGLEHLTQRKVVTRHTNRRKGDSWEAKELFALLDEFEHDVKT